MPGASAAHQRVESVGICNRVGIHFSPQSTLRLSIISAGDEYSTLASLTKTILLHNNSAPPMQRLSLSILAYCAVHVRCSLRNKFYTQTQLL